jgi:hypothetical protein
MGSNRTGRKRSAKGCAMVGATPMSDGLTGLFHGKGLAAAGKDLGQDRSKGSREPAKVSVGNFFQSVPRTAMLNDDEGAPNTFKHNDTAPPGLGEISAGAQSCCQQRCDSCCGDSASMH